jgi:hypothetical protein
VNASSRRLPDDTHHSRPRRLARSCLVRLFHSLPFSGFRRRTLPPGLPSCTSGEVIGLVEQMIRSTPDGAAVTSIDGHREVNYDREANRRQGHCVVHARGDNVVVNYVVEWHDRATGQFAVEIIEQ